MISLVLTAPSMRTIGKFSAHNKTHQEIWLMFIFAISLCDTKEGWKFEFHPLRDRHNEIANMNINQISWYQFSFLLLLIILWTSVWSRHQSTTHRSPLYVLEWRAVCCWLVTIRLLAGGGRKIDVEGLSAFDPTTINRLSLYALLLSSLLSISLRDRSATVKREAKHRTPVWCRDNLLMVVGTKRSQICTPSNRRRMKCYQLSVRLPLTVSFRGKRTESW